MQIRKNFSRYFTDKFFTVTEPVSLDDVHIPFPLPPTNSTDDFKWFFLSAARKKYATGLRKLFLELQACVTAHGYSSYNVRQLYLKMIMSNYISTECMELSSVGVKYLRVITDILKSDKLPKHVSSYIIKDLLSIFKKCRAGIYCRLLDTYSQLTADLSTELMNYRKQLAEQVISLGIAEYNHTVSRLYPDNVSFYEIYTGDQLHVSNSILDRYSNELGIRKSKDPLVRVKGEDLEFIDDFFANKISSALDFDHVIDLIIKTLNIDDFFNEFNKNQSNLAGDLRSLEERLNRYGVDDQFSMVGLFDQDALADDEYKFTPFAKHDIRLSLIRRLSNSGFIREYQKLFTRFEYQNDVAYIFKYANLQLSFIATSEGPKPLLEFMLDKLRNNDLTFTSCIKTKAHKKTFIEHVTANEWRHLLSKLDLLPLRKVMRWIPLTQRGVLIKHVSAEILTSIMSTGKELESFLKLISPADTHEFLTYFASVLKTKADLDRYRDVSAVFEKLQELTSVTKVSFFFKDERVQELLAHGRIAPRPNEHKTNLMLSLLNVLK